MTDSIVIAFHQDGSADAMHKDTFPLAFLGKQSISRASEIMFNDVHQNWDIHLVLPDSGDKSPTLSLSEYAAGFSGYDLARKVEVDWLEQSRLDSVDPLSPEGITHLITAKEKHNA